MSAADIDSLASKLGSTLTIHAEACADSPSGPVATLQLAGLAAATPNANKGASVGIVYDAVMELHLREGHLEHPNRVRELNSRLQNDGLLERCHRLTPKLASDEELLMCHSQEHIQRVDGLYMNPIRIADNQPAEQEGDAYIISGDIFCNRHTSTAARSAAGCAAQAVRAVLSGKVSTAFAVVRPPGHHAESSQLQGFCFFNNVAVAAHTALQQPGLERVLIFDWDIHHGNGTQEIFFGDKRVLCISIHRRDGHFYPEGCGFAAEVGAGDGIGFNVNVPWSSKGMADADYLAAYDLLLDPIIQQFNPQLVLIAAGFDAVDKDWLGKCHVTPAGFAAMTHRLLRHAGGKVVAVLEGGYVPELVGDCASAVMKVLLGDSAPPLSHPRSYTLHRTTKQVLKAVDTIQRQYWPQLAALQPIDTRYTEYATVMKRQLLALGGTPPPQPLLLAEAAPARSTRARTAAAAGTAVAVAVAAPVAPATEPLIARTVARTCAAAEGSPVIAAAPAAVVADLNKRLERVSISENGLDRAQSAPPAADATEGSAAPEAVGPTQTAAGSALEKLASSTAPKRITIKKKGKNAAAATPAAAAAAPPVQPAASTEAMQASSTDYMDSTEQLAQHASQLSTEPPEAAVEQQLELSPAASAKTENHVKRAKKLPFGYAPVAAAAAVQPVVGGLADAGEALIAGPDAAEFASFNSPAAETGSPAAVVASGVNGAGEVIHASEEQRQQQQQQQQQGSPTTARRGRKSPRRSPRVKQSIITTPDAAPHAATAEQAPASAATPSTDAPHWQQQQSLGVTPTRPGWSQHDILVVQQVSRTAETAPAGEAAGQIPASPTETIAPAVDDAPTAEAQSQATPTEVVGGPWLLETPVKSAVGVGQWLLRLVRPGVGPDAQQQQQQEVLEAASMPLPDDA